MVDNMKQSYLPWYALGGTWLSQRIDEAARFSLMEWLRASTVTLVFVSPFVLSNHCVHKLLVAPLFCNDE